MVSGIDDGVGKLLATLTELKLDSDTLIFFLSDNGGPSGSNGSSNHRLRGAKGQWPARACPGRNWTASI